jgi:acetyl esterase/lipase
MKLPTPFLFLLLAAIAAAGEPAITVTRDVPYATPAHERHTLDIHAPAGAKDLPVVFWIHGGGWQAGSKADVQLKPRLFTSNGCVFVAINYRLLPQVDMTTLTRDVARALGWVHRNIAGHGGDPRRILVMGHSAGAQLAALLCTDDRLLRAEGVPISALRGCVPVDGDTFDIPAIVATAETRRRVHGQPEPKSTHRSKFGTEEQHREFSAVTHVAAGKGIPPFLILHISANPDTTIQAQRLAAVLKSAGVPARILADREANHSVINNQLGAPGDANTRELLTFVAERVK